MNITKSFYNLRRYFLDLFLCECFLLALNNSKGTFRSILQKEKQFILGLICSVNFENIFVIKNLQQKFFNDNFLELMFLTELIFIKHFEDLKISLSILNQLYFSLLIFLQSFYHSYSGINLHLTFKGFFEFSFENDIRQSRLNFLTDSALILHILFQKGIYLVLF